jgi:hypothetical protein
MMKQIGFYAMSVVLSIAMAACSSSSSTASTPADVISAVEDAAASADVATGDDLYAPPGTIPPCAISKPLGAVCNPYPGCGSGCPDGYQCAVATMETGQALKCIKKGAVPLGGACDGLAGPYCAEGSCIEGECRASCVDDDGCTNGSSCKQIILPGKPTVCGKTQTTCDPTKPTEICSGGTTCVLLEDDTTNCLATVGKAVQGEACTATADCAGGYTCETGDLGLTCSTVCVIKAQQPDFLCDPGCPDGAQPKVLSATYAACVTKPPPVPCNLFTQDCEDVRKGCYPSNDGGTYCQDIGTAVPGGACKFLNECAKGSFCIDKGDGSDTGVCVVGCDTTDAENKLCQTGAAATCQELGGGLGYCVE